MFSVVFLSEANSSPTVFPLINTQELDSCICARSLALAALQDTIHVNIHTCSDIAHLWKQKKKFRQAAFPWLPIHPLLFTCMCICLRSLYFLPTSCVIHSTLWKYVVDWYFCLLPLHWKVSFRKARTSSILFTYVPQDDNWHKYLRNYIGKKRHSWLFF